MEDIYESSVRTAGDLAGAFEFDGDAGYFYLYDVGGPSGGKIVDAIRICIGAPDFSTQDIKVVWSSDETLVGLIVMENLWALYDIASGAKYGGNYKRDLQPVIPREVLSRF